MRKCLVIMNKSNGSIKHVNKVNGDLTFVGDSVRTSVCVLMTVVDLILIGTFSSSSCTRGVSDFPFLGPGLVLIFLFLSHISLIIPSFRFITNLYVD